MSDVTPSCCGNSSCRVRCTNGTVSGLWKTGERHVDVLAPGGLVDEVDEAASRTGRVALGRTWPNSAPQHPNHSPDSGQGYAAWFDCWHAGRGSRTGHVRRTSPGSRCTAGRNEPQDSRECPGSSSRTSRAGCWRAKRPRRRLEIHGDSIGVPALPAEHHLVGTRLAAQPVAARTMPSAPASSL